MVRPTPRFFSIGHVVSGSQKPILRGVCNRKDESVFFWRISQPPRCGVKVLAAIFVGEWSGPTSNDGKCLYLGSMTILWSETRTVKGLPMWITHFFKMETVGVDRPDRTNVVKYGFITLSQFYLGGKRWKKTQDDLDFFVEFRKNSTLTWRCPRKLVNGI